LFPKLEVWRAGLGKETLWPDWPGIGAIASDAALALLGPGAEGVARLALDDTVSIATYVQSHAANR
jgi:hypothetical protein